MAASVLIVEDEVILGKELARSLQRMGYTIAGRVTSGEKALAQVVELQPDLVLMDIVLTGSMNGIEAADRIRTLCDVPIIYLTAHTEAEVLERARATEPYAYLAKPYTEEQLRTTVYIALYKHKMQKRIEESERKFRLLFENTPLGYQALDEKGHIIEVNKAWLELFGYSRDEVLGKWFGNFLGPGQQDLFVKGYSRLMATGRIRGAELKVATKTGTTLYATIDGLATYDDDGRFTQSHCIIRDDTDRKQAEIALQRQNEYLSTIMESVTNPFYIVNAHDYSVVRANTAAQSKGVVEQSTCHYTTHGRAEPCDDRDFPCPVRELVRTAAPTTVQHIHYGVDGQPRNIEVHAYPIVDGRGKVSQIIEYCLDVTERKRVEEDRHRLATAIEQSADSVVITDSQGTIQYVNPAFERLTGYARDEVVGRNPRILKSGKQSAAFYSQLWKTLSAGRVWRGRLVNKTRDGRLVEEDATISPVMDASGKIVNYVAVKHDVTTEVQLQKQLVQAQKMESIGTLAGGIAHDFNNLLQVVVGYTAMLLMDKDENHPDGEALAAIRQAAHDGAGLIKGLLTFSRKVEYYPRPVNLNQEVKRVYKILPRMIPKMIDVQMRLADGLRPINADPNQFEQILLNLAVNAHQAMPGGGTLTIETANVTLDEYYCKLHLDAAPGDHVRLTISDTGVGMDREVLEHIFEPFFTTKEPGVGTGLGLATVFGLIKTHQGHITCESEPAVGTSFNLYFPAIQRPSKLEVPVRETPPVGGTETLMLVDDDAKVRGFVKNLLVRAGYTVLTAPDGVEALEVFKERGSEISLVILDFIMPKMSGAECLRKLLEIDPHAKVLIASGYTARGKDRELMENASRGILSKPYDAPGLLGAVRKALDEGDKVVH